MHPKIKSHFNNELIKASGSTTSGYNQENSYVGGYLMNSHHSSSSELKQLQYECKLLGK